jgi:hypothetical protein
MQKKCSKCKFIYENAEEFFYKVPRLKSGLSSWCKKCQQSKNAELAKTKDGKNKAYARNKKYREKSKNIERPILSTRICSFCKVSKEISFFKIRSANKDGFSCQCKDCEYIQTTKSRQKYKIKKWAYFLLKDAERHSDKPILIDENFILELFEKQNGLCYWFKVKLQPSSEAKYPWQPSLDRLDRFKGYEPGNVVLACYSANIGRNTASAEIFNMFVIDLKTALKD